MSILYCISGLHFWGAFVWALLFGSNVIEMANHNRHGNRQHVDIDDVEDHVMSLLRQSCRPMALPSGLMSAANKSSPDKLHEATMVNVQNAIRNVSELKKNYVRKTLEG